MARSAINDLIQLSDGSASVAILPQVGGRVVQLRHHGGENLLYAPEAWWSHWRSLRPDPADKPAWQSFCGHITWLGPQSGFWNQQNLRPEKYGEIWPPDPYQIYGDFEVVERSDVHLELLGPVSRYTGMQLRKRFEVDQHQVKLTVTGTNRRNTPVSWDLWSNTRVRPDIPTRVPMANASDVRIQANTNPPIDWAITPGGFSFTPSAAAPGAKVKAFINASAPHIAALFDDTLFVKSFAPTSPDKIHPDQALVEVYLNTASEEDPGLQELEFHGPFTTLGPDESMTQFETWTLLPRLETDPTDWLKRVTLV